MDSGSPRPRLFDHRRITPKELPGVLNKHIFTGALGTAWGNLIGGVLYVSFGNVIGMTQFQWGILGAVSSWVIALQPLAALMVDKAGSRKKVWFWSCFLERVLRAVGIFSSYLLWKTGHLNAALALMTGITLGVLLGTFQGPPWYSWLADIVPPEIHGRFWGRRETWVSIATIAAVVPASLLVDLVPESAKGDALAAVFAFTTVIGMIDVFVHVTIPEPEMRHVPPSRFFHRLQEPLRDPKFRPWLLFVLAWNFSMMLGYSLSNLYFLKDLRLRNNLFGMTMVMTVLTLLTGVLTARTSGRLIDKIGIQRVLYVGYILWSLIPVVWLFAVPSTVLFWLAMASLIGGSFSVAANMAGIKLLTRTPPAESRTMYVAVSNTLGLLAQGVGAFLAGSFLEAFGSRSLRIVGLVVSGFPLVFIASAALRLVSTLLLVPRIVVEPKGPGAKRS